MHKDEETEFDFESEAEESGALEKLTDKLAKAKKELKACKEERQEFLDGWQRLRAEVANQKRDDSTLSARMKDVVREQILEDILPALDAFDMAMHAETWQSVDSAWRAGMEYVHAQLIGALEKNGIVAFGAPGDKYSPHEHEAISTEKDDADGGDVVATVTRRGYRLGDRILRPAQVTVTSRKT